MSDLPIYPLARAVRAAYRAGEDDETMEPLVRVDGTEDDKPVRIDGYVNAPGLVEAFETSGLSHEAYLTGQCASVFVKMMVDDAFAEKGLYVPEQLHADAIQYCFRELAGLGITVDEIVEKGIA